MSFSIQNFLLKKTLGATDSNPQSTDITGETPGFTLPKVFTSQINTQQIPPTSPTAPTSSVSYSNTNTSVTVSATTLITTNTSATPDLVFTGYIDANGGITGTSTTAYGLLYTSKTYPWIQYVDRLQLPYTIQQTPAYSFGPSILLTNSIPTNYDTSSSTYKISVNVSSGTFNSLTTVAGNQYVIEKDAGYIYFINTNWSTPTLSSPSIIPLISFYRYNGTIGIPTNLGNFAGAYNQGTNAIAYGNNAGQYAQGTGSIAIGYLAGPTGMTSNSIALNASGTGLFATGPTGGFYVAPVGSYSGSTGPFTLLAYGADKQIVSVTGTVLTNMGIGGGGSSITVTGISNNTNYMVGLLNGTGTASLIGVDSTFTYNPSTHVLTVAGLGVTNNTTVGGTLGVTNATTLAGLTAGTTTLNSLGVTNNTTVGGTLGVTNATTLAGLTAGTTTLSSLGVTNNTTVGGTLGVTNATTLAGLTAGTTTLSSLVVTNATTLTGGITGSVSFNNSFTQGGYTNWISSLTSSNIIATACSFNGQYQLVVTLLNVYLSSNSGSTWSTIYTAISLQPTYNIIFNSTNNSATDVGSGDSGVLYTISTIGTVTYSSGPPNASSNAIVISNTAGGTATNYLSSQIYSIGASMILSNHTLSIWFYFPTISNVNQTFLSCYYTGTFSSKVYYTNTLSIQCNSSNNLSFTYFLINGTPVNFTSSSTLVSNTWYNVVITFLYPGSFIIYLNGIQIGTLGSSNVNFAYILFGTGVTTTTNNTPFTTNSASNVYLADFRIYRNIILTNSQVSSLYNNTLYYGFTHGSMSSNGTNILISSYGNLLLSTNTGSSFTSTISSINANYTAISGNGQYMLASTTNNILYLSTNSGISWTQITGISTNASKGFALSYTGQYMIVNGLTNVYYSNNSALSFIYINNNRLISMSVNGQYSIYSNLITTYYIYYGLSLLYTNTVLGNIVSGACSNTGQYMVLVTSGTSNNVYYSTNYGSSFTGISVGSTAMVYCSISYDGSYITVANVTTVYTLNSNSTGYSIALGQNAGITNQAKNAIAVGYNAGNANQTANSIIFNASGTVLNSYTQGFYVSPIAKVSDTISQTVNLLGYGTTDNQIVQSGISIVNNTLSISGPVSFNNSFTQGGYTNWVTGMTGTSIVNTASSSNGQYQLAVTSSVVYLSSNSGSLWSNILTTPMYAMNTGLTNQFTFNNNSYVDVIGSAAVTAVGTFSYTSGPPSNPNSKAIIISGNPSGSSSSGSTVNYLYSNIALGSTTPTFSLSAWVLFPVVASGNCNFIAMGSSTFASIWIQNNSGNMSFNMNNNINNTSNYNNNTLLFPNTWYHITLTYSNPGSFICYVNGIQVYTATSAAFQSNIDYIVLGTSYSGNIATGSYYAANSYLSDVRIYKNKILSATDVITLYINTTFSYGSISASGQNIIVATNGLGGGYTYISSNYGSTITPNVPYIYLPFDTLPTTGSKDSMGNTTLTVTGSPTLVSGVVGNAVYLSNTPSGNVQKYYTMPWVPPTSFTINFWINFQDISSNQWIISSDAQNANTMVIYINNSSLVFYVASAPKITASITTVNTWYNISLIYQSGGTSYLYVNYQLIGTYNNTPSTSGNTTIRIGGVNNVAFNGYIDDFKIYNYALFPQNYNYTAISGNGQYMLASTTNNGLYMSSNSGSTWSQVPTISNNNYINPNTTTNVGTGVLTIFPYSSSWTNSGITWTSTASASYTSNYLPWVAFNNVFTVSTAPYSWATPAIYSGATYNGTTPTSIVGVGSIKGEWLQIQSSVPLIMYSYTFSCGGYNQIPQTYYIVGSNDNSLSNWYPIQYVVGTGSISPFGTSANNFRGPTSPYLVNFAGTQTISYSTVTPVTTNTYNFLTTLSPFTYFRLIFVSLYAGGGNAELEEWFINFYLPSSTLTYAPSISYTGQYMLTNSYYSNNYGSSWNNTTPYFTSLVTSANGQTTLATNNSSYYVSPTLNAPIVTSGLVMYLDAGNLASYSGSGTTWTDMTGSGMVFILYGGSSTLPTYQSANGGYLSFVPASSQYAQSTTAPTFGLLSNFTIEAWIYYNGTNTGIDPCILTQAFNNTSSSPYINYVLQNNVRFYNGAWINGTSYSSFTAGNWYHVVGTYNGANLILYVNGVSQTTVGTTAITVNGDQGINLMKRWDGNEFWGGGLAVIRIYNTALSDVQVAQNYNAERFRFITPFNNSIGTIMSSACSDDGKYMSFVTSNQTIYGEWIQYQLTTGVSITSYSIQPRTSANARYPVAWYILGSNDGINWTILDAQNNQTSSVWGVSFTLKNASSVFTYFRIIFTQVNTGQYIIDLGGFILYNNGTSIFGPYTNYSVPVSNNYYNVLQYNSVTVCTVTWSWPNTNTNPNSMVNSNALGIGGDGTLLPLSNAQPGWLATTNGYTNSSYWMGFSLCNNGPAYEYNSSLIAIQGTFTTIANVYYSSNYGSSFTGINVYSTNLSSCAISYDGSYITVANATTVYTLNTNATGYSVAMGQNAGTTNQALDAIAIGYNAGTTNQSANSIIFNASGTALNSFTQGFYVSPIANVSTTTSQTVNLLGYGTTDNQVVQSGISFANSQQTIYGEWIQYQLATAVSITSYVLQPRSSFNVRYPIAWTIVGSLDGINWTLLDTQSGKTQFLWGNTFTLKAASPVYTYFRIIFTQLTTNNNIVDLGGFILYNNGNSIFGPSASYSASGGVLTYNSVSVCTITYSWPATGTTTLGITNDNGTIGFLPTTNGYTNASYSMGFIVQSIGSAYEYNSSYIAIQGTSTVITAPYIQVTDLYNNIKYQSSAQYPLDVNGTIRTQSITFQDGSIQSTASPLQPNWSTFGQNWVATTTPSTGWYACALSYSGQYQVAVATALGYLYVSSNYGQTWTNAITQTGFSWCATSSSGQYMGAVYQGNGTKGGFYWSSNYGKTWNLVMVGTIYFEAIAISGTGQYITITPAYTVTGSIYISSNYGQTWSTLSQQVTSGMSTCMSYSGQYQLITSYGNVYVSSNYGQTWTSTATITYTNYTTSISASGQYMAYCNSNGTLGLWTSSNYGQSWTQILSSAIVTIAISASGQYQIACNGTSVYISTNYGQTFSSAITTSVTFNAISISGSGVYILGSSSSNVVYMSTVSTSLSSALSSSSGPLRLQSNTSGSVPNINDVFCNGLESYFATRDIYVNLGAYIRILNVNTNTGYPTAIRGGAITFGTTDGLYGGNSVSWSNNNTAREMMRIDPYGNVGIGTTSPNYTLDVNGTIRVTGATTLAGLTVTGALTCTGDITAFYSASDIRLKKNIKSLDSSLDIIKSLHPVTFTWKEDIYNTEHQNKDDVGFIAQEVEAIIPFATGQFDIKDDTFKKIRHERIIPYVVKSIQELSEKIDRLEEENKLLKIKLEKLM